MIAGATNSIRKFLGPPLYRNENCNTFDASGPRQQITLQRCSLQKLLNWRIPHIVSHSLIDSIAQFARSSKIGILPKPNAVYTKQKIN